MQLTESDIKRFWVKVDIRGEDECWPWLAFKNKNGYGTFSVGTRETQTKEIASRVAYTIAYGPLGELHVLHECDNPECVNPRHLFSGTNIDNMKDKKLKGRAPRTDGNAKINFEIAEQIRADKRPYKVLTEVYGLTKSTISYIKNNRIWTSSPVSGSGLDCKSGVSDLECSIHSSSTTLT